MLHASQLGLGFSISTRQTTASSVFLNGGWNVQHKQTLMLVTSVYMDREESADMKHLHLARIPSSPIALIKAEQLLLIGCQLLSVVYIHCITTLLTTICVTNNHDKNDMFV